jgi:hypothetical protein
MRPFLVDLSSKEWVHFYDHSFNVQLLFSRTPNLIGNGFDAEISSGEIPSPQGMRSGDVRIHSNDDILR